MSSRAVDEEATLHKSKVRLLKLLNRTGPIGFKLNGPSIFIENHKFPEALVKKLSRENLLEVTKERVSINANGSAFLKRSLHPDNPYVAQNLELEPRTTKIDGCHHKVIQNVSESPLARLYQRKNSLGKTWINEPQFSAGERIRSDFEKAQLQPNISSNWEASVATSSRGEGVADISDFALDARRRLENALINLGPDLSGIVLDVCCFLKGLESIERERGWPPRSAKLLLRTALSSLARHYGMGLKNTKDVNTHWATAGNRSTLNF